MDFSSVVEVFTQTFPWPWLYNCILFFPTCHLTPVPYIRSCQLLSFWGAFVFGLCVISIYSWRYGSSHDKWKLADFLLPFLTDNYRCKGPCSSFYAIISEVQYCTKLTPCRVTPVSTSPDYTGNSTSVIGTIPGGIEVHMTPWKLADFLLPFLTEVMFESEPMNISCTFKYQVCAVVIYICI